MPLGLRTAGGRLLPRQGPLGTCQSAAFLSARSKKSKDHGVEHDPIRITAPSDQNTIQSTLDVTSPHYSVTLDIASDFRKIGFFKYNQLWIYSQLSI